MKSIVKVFLIINILVLSACERMITDVDIDPGRKKLVVHSYLYPGMDTVKVMLTSSLLLYSSTELCQGPSNNEVDDAQIVIRNKNIEYPLTYNDSIKQYISTELEIKKGETYNLYVKASEGEELFASCTVPGENPPDIEILSIQSDTYGGKIINFRFRDLNGQGHYYRICGVYKYFYAPEPESFHLYSIYMDKGEEFVTDINKDGEYFIYKTNWIYLDEEPNPVTLFLALTDIHYYNYHRSVFNFDGENPFSEPSPVYSNIEGGLGFFAAFNGSTIEVDLE